MQTLTSLVVIACLLTCSTVCGKASTTLLGEGIQPIVSKENYMWFIRDGATQTVMRTDGTVKGTTQGTPTPFKKVGISTYHSDHVFFYSQEPNTNVLYIGNGTATYLTNMTIPFTGEDHYIDSVMHFPNSDYALLVTTYETTEHEFYIINVKQQQVRQQITHAFTDIAYDNERVFVLVGHQLYVYDFGRGQQYYLDAGLALVQIYVSKPNYVYVLAVNGWWVFDPANSRLVNTNIMLPASLERRIIMKAATPGNPDRFFAAQQEGLFLCDLDLTKTCTTAFAFPGDNFNYDLLEGAYVPSKGLLYFIHRPTGSEGNWHGAATTMYNCDGTIIRRMGELIYPGPLAKEGNDAIFTGLRYVPKQDALFFLASDIQRHVGNDLSFHNVLMAMDVSSGAWISAFQMCQDAAGNCQTMDYSADKYVALDNGRVIATHQNQGMTLYEVELE